jgi:uncharacterized protein YecT (DUF1311 family)
MRMTGRVQTTAALIATILAQAMPLLGTPAMAGDNEAVTACLQDARDNDRDAHACIGRIADACAETPEGQSTQGTVACNMREEKAWDALLNAEYQRLIRLLKKPEAIEDLRKAQRLWLTARDADCRVPYYFYDGGTIVQILGARCQLEHTAGRALLIRSWREMAQGE